MNGKFDRIWRIFTRDNPILIGLLGLCPALAVTVSVRCSLLIGALITVVLTVACTLGEAFGRHMSAKVRMAMYLLVSAAFVSAAELMCAAYLPKESQMMGILLPVSAMSSIIVYEAVRPMKKRRSIGGAVVHGLLTGVSFTVSAAVIAVIREIAGAGTLFAGADGSGGVHIPESAYTPAEIVLLPCGALMIFGLAAALVSFLGRSRRVDAREVSDD